MAAEDKLISASFASIAYTIFTLQVKITVYLKKGNDLLMRPRFLKVGQQTLWGER